MPIYRPSELILFLKKLGRGAKRQLSQNFLIDGNIVRKIIDAVDPHFNETIIEIGPGPGALTEQFFLPTTEGTRRISHLYAIEQDDDFARELSRFVVPNGPKITVVNTDVLKISFQDLLQGTQSKLVSNLPYHLTGPILEHIFNSYDLFVSVTIMVQYEVAMKIIHNQGAESWLSLLIRYYAKSVLLVAEVPRRCFMPAPKVTSAILHIDILNTLPFNKEETARFFSFIKKIFSMKRKTIFHILHLFGIEKILIEQACFFCAIQENRRPQELNVQQWIQLYQYIYLEKL